MSFMAVIQAIKAGKEATTGIVSGISNAVNRRKLREKGSQEEREKRTHEDKMARLAHSTSLGSKILFFITVTPFVFLLFLIVFAPFLKLITGLEDILIDYENVIKTLSVSMIMTVIGVVLGIDKLGSHMDKGNKVKLAEKRIEKEITIEVEKIKNTTQKLDPFEIAYFGTKQHEGGWVNDKDDRGGETYAGISRIYHSKWKGWKIIDEYKKDESIDDTLKKNKELQSMIKEFYYKIYWKGYKCDQLPAKIGIELFDTSVNTGSHGIKFLQSAINKCNFGKPDILVDGKIGGATIEAVDEICPKYEKALYNAMNGFQFKHYEGITNRDPSQEKFFRGWMNRT